MKAIVISDIHGIKTNLKLIEEKYRELKCEKLIVLGDLYYQNEKNNDYDPKSVRSFLQAFSNNLVCIMGNCDFRINKSEEPFPIENDSVINIQDNIYITHGHVYNDSNWPLSNSILIFGHYHIPFIKKIGNNIYINPGSISKQRNNNLPSYLFINDNEFTIFNIEGSIISTIRINS